MALTITGCSKADDGTLAVLFSNGSMALVRDPPPTEMEAFEAAAHFIPGGEPFWVRRGKIPEAIYVHPAE